MKSTTPAAIALSGMLRNWADCGSCAIAIPPSALMARSPSRPSAPEPDSTTPMALRRASSARDRKKVSIGRCRLPVFSRGTSATMPP